ncbi:MAG: hypothetical protein ABIH34_06425 [Nanoarchaeota archaeon]
MYELKIETVDGSRPYLIAEKLQGFTSSGRNSGIKKTANPVPLTRVLNNVEMPATTGYGGYVFRVPEENITLTVVRTEDDKKRGNDLLKISVYENGNASSSYEREISLPKRDAMVAITCIHEASYVPGHGENSLIRIPLLVSEMQEGFEEFWRDNAGRTKASTPKKNGKRGRKKTIDDTLAPKTSEELNVTDLPFWDSDPILQNLAYYVTGTHNQY